MSNATQTTGIARLVSVTTFQEDHTAFGNGPLAGTVCHSHTDFSSIYRLDPIMLLADAHHHTSLTSTESRKTSNKNSIPLGTDHHVRLQPRICQRAVTSSALICGSGFGLGTGAFPETSTPRRRPKTPTIKIQDLNCMKPKPLHRLPRNRNRKTHNDAGKAVSCSMQPIIDEALTQGSRV